MIEADVRAEVAVEMQEQLALLHQNYQTSINEQATTTQKKYVNVLCFFAICNLIGCLDFCNLTSIYSLLFNFLSMTQTGAPY